MGKTDRKLEKAVKMMADRGLDGLVIFSRGNISILGPSYLHYFAGVRPFGRMNAAVVTKSGDAVLLVGPSWDAPRVARKTWIDDVGGTSAFHLIVKNKDAGALMKGETLLVTGAAPVVLT